MAPHSATSATRWKPNAEICSTFNLRVCGTEARRVLERLGRGEDVDAGEYTFRGAVKIETGADSLDWLNKGIFISVGGRQRGGVIYEVYLVG